MSSFALRIQHQHGIRVDQADHAKQKTFMKIAFIVRSRSLELGVHLVLQGDAWNDLERCMRSVSLSHPGQGL